MKKRLKGLMKMEVTTPRFILNGLGTVATLSLKHVMLDNGLNRFETLIIILVAFSMEKPFMFPSLI